MNERERDKFKKWADANLAWDEMRGLYEGDAIAYEAWQTALSTRKPYGYGIVDKDGKPAFGVTLTKSSADMHIRAYRDAGKVGHRVVELFYEDSES